MSAPAADWTLERARDWARARADDGVDCPCCRQKIKVYRRRLNHVPTAALIALYCEAGRDWAHLPTIVRRRLPSVATQGGYAVLAAHWELMVEERTRRDDGGRAGWWRVTERGEEFVGGRLLVPSHVRLYDDRRLGFSGSYVGVCDCLGARFSYDELMAGA